MTIRIGYCCINTVLQSPNRTCRLINATQDRILELARQNLAALEAILHWNLEHGIRLFRISSETIPFGSHPINHLAWWEILQPELMAIGDFVLENGMRVSIANFYQQVSDRELDIMLEVKDKEQSVLAVYERFPELRAPVFRR